jgi:endonuclease YncB( thermonuclease family)
MQLGCRHWLLIASASLCWVTAAGADDCDFSGTVGRVFDGDSFLVRPTQARDRKSNIDVRLQDIDAPEKSQPYGDTARAALVDMIADRDVFVDVIDTDRYGRKIVRVFREPDRFDVIKALVRDGHVWVYRRKVHDASLVGLENTAREARRGLWALPEEDLMPPWQYRYLRRKDKSTTKVLFLTGQRPWHQEPVLESAQTGRFHEPITPVAASIVIPPGAVSGSEAGAGWPIVVPQAVEVADHFQRQR